MFLRSKLLQIISISGLITLIGLITGVIQARLLGPEGRGILGDILFWINLNIILFGFGLPEYIIKLVSKNERLSTKTFLNFLFAVTFFCLIVSLLLLFIKGNYLYFFVFITPIFSWSTLVILGAINGTENYKSFNLIRTIQPSVYLITLLAFYFFSISSVESFLYANLISNIIVLLISMLIIYQPISKLKVIKHEQVIKKSTALYFSIVLLGISSQAERMFAVIVLNNFELGVYLVNYTYVFLVSGMVATSLYSYYSPTFSKFEPQNFISKLYKVLLLATILLSIILSPLLIFYKEIIGLIFGMDYLLPMNSVYYFFLASISSGLKLLIGKLTCIGHGNKLIYISEFLFFLILALGFILIGEFSITSFLNLVSMINIFLIIGLFTALFISRNKHAR